MPIVKRHETSRGSFSEWQFVPAVLEREPSPRCLVYSFGVASNDEFTNFYASRGCHVFAFDPTVHHAREWMRNVTFHPWGLRSSSADFGGIVAPAGYVSARWLWLCRWISHNPEKASIAHPSMIKAGSRRRP